MAPGVFYFRRELSFACVPAHFWVHVSADYWMYVDDPDLVKNTVSHTRTVLDWYASHLRSDGLLGKMTWWEFADWTANYRFWRPAAGQRWWLNLSNAPVSVSFTRCHGDGRALRQSRTRCVL